jgi:hypothetical protein
MAWFCGLLGMFFLGGFMSLFDKTTQIAPAQDGIQNACMIAACAVALLSAAIVFWQLREQIIGRRVLFAAIVAMLGFGSSVFLFSEIASFFEGWMDFPPGATRTAIETMPITYAYHHQGRHVDVWNIEVGDALLGIAPGDANFMLSHRLPGDTSGGLGQMWSGGYFCARLTIQRAGDAKRVLHTGSNDLAPGSVILCPKANAPLVKKGQK